MTDFLERYGEQLHRAAPRRRRRRVRASLIAVAADAPAILRRPQTARDRRLAKPKLRYTGGEISGVQVDSVRALSPNYALVPAIKAGTRTAGNVCILGSGGGTCAPAASVAEQGVAMSSGGLKGSHYIGVVPDRVARVRFTPNGGAPVEADVRDNFYDLRTAEHSPAGRVDAPPGVKTGPDGKVAGPGGPAHGLLEWLDASGRVIGPP